MFSTSFSTMSTFRIKVLLSVLLLIVEIGTISFAMDTSPVFILDNGLLDGVAKTQTNPLLMTSPEEFEVIVDFAQKRSHCLVFFVEDEFSFEDISSKDEIGTPFFHLKQEFLDKRAKLLPRVFEPYNYLKNRFQPFDFNTFHVRQTTTKLRLEEDYKFMYIFFEDGTNETRTQKLRRHDIIIQEVTFAVGQLTKGPVVAFYTGKHNPVEIENDARKQTPKITRPSPTIPGKTIAALCGTASFEFVDTIMRHAEEKPSFLKVEKCDYKRHGKDGWSYTITIKDLGQEENTSHSSYYELIFYFNFVDPKNPPKGWRLNRVSYGPQNREVRKTKWFEVTSGWNEYFENPRHLVMQLDANISTLPSLEMKTFRIYLGNDMASTLLPPLPTSCTTESTTEDLVTQTRYFRIQKPEDNAFTEMLSNLTQVFSYADEEYALRSSTTVEPVERYVDIIILDCLIIVFILIFVLLYAVQMLMGIKTNSIYDSPDQPPLFTHDIGE